MSDDEKHPQHLLSIDPVTRAAIGRMTHRASCPCLTVRTKKGTPLVPKMHVEAQDETKPGWALIKQLVAHAEIAHSSVLEPSAHIPWDDWLHVVTLPPDIGSLTEIRALRLYGSPLRRLPPEIGAMSALQDLDVYTSYCLHWLPYEVTRCRHLTSSRMSTRALYGNRKTRLPFPPLRQPIETLLPQTCSVCDRAFGERAPELFWTTQRIGTDFVPLLIHGCSRDCIDSVPSAPAGFFARPHKGGGGVGMPLTGQD